MRIVPIQDASVEDKSTPPPADASIWCQRMMCVLWPAFLVAGLAEGIFFTLFDPEDLHPFGAPLDVSRTAAYTIGFFAFWALGALASAGTVMLRESKRAD